MSPADKKRALNAGWRPYTIFGRSYENAPDLDASVLVTDV